MNENGHRNSPWKILTRFADGEPLIERAPEGKKGSTVRHDALDEWVRRAEAGEPGIHVRFARWLLTNAEVIYRRLYHVFAVLVCVVLIVTLLLTVSFLPEFGNPDNPAHNEVSARYIEQGLEETGAVNIVSGMILDYRAFDTLGESHVLFIAACCVIILLRLDRDGSGKPVIKEMGENLYARNGKTDSILRCTASLLIPMIFIFGIYVILNGHLSAGGGFSGGAVLGSGLILYRNAYGVEKTRRFFNYNTFRWVSFGALICYCGLKAYAFYTGANGLEDGIGLGTPGAILSGGLILPLNICVGCVVACTMYGFYALFSEGGM